MKVRQSGSSRLSPIVHRAEFSIYPGLNYRRVYLRIFPSHAILAGRTYHSYAIHRDSRAGRVPDRFSANGGRLGGNGSVVTPDTRFGVPKRRVAEGVVGGPKYF